MKLQKKDNKNSGLTLIEALLYTALSTLIITGVLISAYPILTGANYMSQKVTTESESVFVLRKIAWAVGQGVTGISVPATNSVNINTTTGTINIALNSERIEVNGVPITAERVPITDFEVIYTPKAGSAPGYLEVSFIADGLTVGPVRYNLYF